MRHSQKVQKESIKEKIIAQLKEEDLEVVSFSNKNIYWEEEGKEFYLNGEMYDVVKTKTINGKLMLYCINDKKEKQLIDNYNSITKNNSSSDKKGKNIVDNSINLFVYSEEESTRESFRISLNKYSSFISPLAQNTAGKFSPPPKA